MADTSQKERHRRFVAFAFAMSDLLLEIDEKYKIHFAEGSLAGLKFSGIEHLPDLIGKDFRAMMVKKDRALVEASVSNMTRTGRLSPISISLNTQGKPSPVILGGFFLPGTNVRFNLSMTLNNKLYCQESPALKRDENSGLLDAETFAAKAKERAVTGKMNDSDLEMGMLVIAGLKELKESGDPAKVEEFMQKLGAMLRSWSLGGDTAGLVGDEKFSFVGEEGLDAQKMAAIQKEADKILGADAKKVSISSVTANLDTANLSEEDASKALLHCLQKFANESPGSFNIKSLSEGVTDYLDGTVERIKELRKIIDARNFHLAFQPIVDLRSRAVDHYEVLSRFEGLMSPLELIQFAENVGMIHDLDLVIVHQTLNTLIEREKKEGWRPRVSINLSAKSMQNELFMKSLRKLTRNSDFARLTPQIIFEVTETSMIEDLQKLNGAIQTLRKDGHGISIDDVGSGNTSFTMLNSIDADHAKIDGALVRGFLDDTRAKNILKSVIDSCKNMGFDVICEHIEHEDEARQLMVMGAHLGQGYLFGKPTADGKPPNVIVYGKGTDPVLGW
ncbi:EAL domain-containing protein [Magnetospira thiophila]